MFTALASFLDARHAGGQWLLRIEDIDPPRETRGATESILRCLDEHGLHHDSDVLYQHTRSRAYDLALEQLEAQGRLFHCACTRRELRQGGNCGGRCGGNAARSDRPVALRVRVTDDFEASFTDVIQGEQTLRNTEIPRDFVVRRKDGLYAYQLAVVVDEEFQGITHVIRGADLLPTTFQQRYLQQALALPSPAYGHVPVVTDTRGRKLSKQNHAPAVDGATPLATLRRLLRLLGQREPAASTLREALHEAAWQWDREAVRGISNIPG